MIYVEYCFIEMTFELQFLYFASLIIFFETFAVHLLKFFILPAISRTFILSFCTSRHNNLFKYARLEYLMLSDS